MDKDSMNNNDEKDRRLLENLDHLLAGRENEIEESLDEDTSSSLDTARRMASMSGTPSKEFSENLKAQLTHRLAEQEKRDSTTNQHFLLWEVSRHTIWQGTIAAAILLIIVVIIFLVNLLSN